MVQLELELEIQQSSCSSACSFVVFPNRCQCVLPQLWLSPKGSSWHLQPGNGGGRACSCLGGRNGTWILLWGWGDAGYSCLAKGFGCCCPSWLGGSGRVVGLFCQRHRVFITIAFFSVQWLLQSFAEIAKIILFGIHCSDLSRNRIRQIHKEAFSTVAALVNL